MTEPKHAKDMTAEEYAAKLAELRRGPPMAPQPSPEKRANQMTEAERVEWLREHKKRHQ
jgi:hypothetical protein